MANLEIVVDDDDEMLRRRSENTSRADRRDQRNGKEKEKRQGEEPRAESSVRENKIEQIKEIWQSIDRSRERACPEGQERRDG
jgi:hypothetical protein